MKKFFFSAIYFIIFTVFLVHADNAPTYGYLKYSTMNIGDDIQSLAAQRFLPKDSVGIDREFVGVFNSHAEVKTIMNGWFLHVKGRNWFPPKRKAPAICWPPSSSIDPLLISMHFTESVFPVVFTPEGTKYLKKHGPVGARDNFTLKELQKRNIPSYFSGCLTLTLENEFTTRNNIIYLVDLDQECVNYIKAHAKCLVECLTHTITENTGDLERLGKAQKLLDKYKKAKCVITTRLHASLPCLAFNTPVLKIDSNSEPNRFEGLNDLLYHCSKKELLSGKFGFDFNKPPKNPNLHLELRENLIKKVLEWKSKCERRNKASI